MAEKFRDLSLNSLGKMFSDALSPCAEFPLSVTVLSIAQQMEQSLPEKARYEAYRVEIIVNLPRYNLKEDDQISF